jgi:Tol biopolymer transport system component
MPLATGEKLGPYEILAAIGAGGMGEVYHAHDSRLGRDVAIKVSSEHFSERLEREARAIAALNHPHIATLYDVGEHKGALYLAMEFVKGAPLKGPYPVKEAIGYGIQVAEGLAAAHEAGIVHRDLKPANVLVTKKGSVKILDFGLAKLTEATPAGMTAPTQTAAIAGTPGYLAPEQLQGKPADSRSDIFAFGCILYELVSGRRAFGGETLAATLAATAMAEPKPLEGVPEPLAELIGRCLRKDPERRLQHIADARIMLEDIRDGVSSAPPVAPPAARRTVRWWALAAGVGLVALVAGLIAGRAFFGREGEDLARYRFTSVATEPGIKSGPAWSPDGRTIAYAAQADGVYQIFTRGPDQPVPAQLTHSASDSLAPFWSPDNTRVFYISGQALWEMGAAGGTPEMRLRGIRTAHISPDGKTLAFARGEANDSTSLWVQPIDGSEAHRLGPIFPGANAYVRFAPDGAWIGFWAVVGDGKLAFWRVSYPQGEARQALVAASNVRGATNGTTFTWFPDSRHIVFSGELIKEDNNHLLMADTKTGAIRPVTVGLYGEADPSLSSDGSRLAFTARTTDQDIVEIPLDGSPMRSVLATSTVEHCAAWSPRGDQFAYSKQRNGSDEIWIHNVADGFERPLITAASFREGKTDRVSEARFSPDGQRIAFVRVSEGVNTIWLASVAGGPPVPLGVEGMVPAWSPDGNWIAFTRLVSSGAGLFKVSAGGGGQPVTLIPPGGGGPGVVRTQWSLRGDWLTWVGKRGLEVVSPDGSRRELLSGETGWQPAQGFSKDGGTVFAIRANQDRHFVVEAFEIADKRERTIVDLGPQVQMHAYSLAPDGKSFLTTLHRLAADIWILDGFGKP